MSGRAPRGQNFLQPEGQARVAAAIGPAAALVEIGGGPGGLTEKLAAQTQKLWVIENDPVLAENLHRKFRDAAHVTVIERDVLEVDFTGLVPNAPLRVAGNLPYYITSPILRHLFAHSGAITDAVLMMQREVAQRLTAAPGSREFGLLTAMTQLYARPRHLFDLPPGAFRPAPKVHSSLVRLDVAPRATDLGVEAEPFLAFLRRAFEQKRKQLGPRLGVNLAAAGLPANARAEQLSLEQLAALYRYAASRAHPLLK